MSTRTAAGPLSAAADTSALRFLTVDGLVPESIRQLLEEADGCVKMGFLNGGTACARRAVHTVIDIEEARADDYDECLRLLAEKHPAVPPQVFQILALLGAGDDPLDAEALNALVVTLKAIVYELYVVGPERVERLMYVHRLVEALNRGPVVVQHPAAKGRRA